MLLQTLDEKHKSEVLEIKIKNLQAELQHILKENEYCREAAAEAHVKVANIYEDYEKNQVILMKKNKTLLLEVRNLQSILNQIDQAVQRDKLKSQALNEALGRFKQTA